MSSEHGKNPSLDLQIKELFSVLSHEIRSPLSIISNEVSCLEPSPETAAIKNSLKEIVSIIDHTCAYQDSDCEPAHVTVKDFCDALGNGAVPAPNLSLNSSLTLKDYKTLICAFQQILKEISSPSKTTIRIESNYLEIHIVCNAKSTRRNQSPFLLPQFLLNQNASPLTLMLAELTLRAHDADLSRSDDGISIILELCAPPPP